MKTYDLPVGTKFYVKSLNKRFEVVEDNETNFYCQECLLGNFCAKLRCGKYVRKDNNYVGYKLI